MTLFNQAVENLCGGAHYKLFGDDAYENITEWFIDNPPTKAQVIAEVARLQAEYQAKQYQRNRAAEYPSFADQFDTLYHGGYDAWKAQIDAIKLKYPKP